MYCLTLFSGHLRLNFVNRCTYYEWESSNSCLLIMSDCDIVWNLTMTQNAGAEMVLQKAHIMPALLIDRLAKLQLCRSDLKSLCICYNPIQAYRQPTSAIKHSVDR